ncbi:VOC family protein, partial [Streptomyces sp. SID4931]
AQRMGDAERAAELLAEAAAVPLDPAERASAGDALARLAELRD